MHVSHGRSGQPSEQRTATFTGTVHMDPVLNAPGVMINTVIFTPGARTYWHRHPGGQLLALTAGRGIVATRDGDTTAVTSGDVVWAEPGSWTRCPPCKRPGPHRSRSPTSSSPTRTTITSAGCRPSPEPAPRSS